MPVAYVDSSCIVAIALGERSADRVTAVLRRYSRWVSSNLLEAEVRAVLSREHVIPTADTFASVDWVLASQTMHHFSPAAAPEVLTGLARVARRAVLIADLRKSAAARILFAMAARVLRFDPMTRRDGDTSIRRGFSVRSLELSLERAGMPARVVRRLGWRLASVWSAT